jgi:hypothetical protein
MQRLRLCVGRRRTVSLTGLPLALQIDAGYIKTTRPQADGKRWVPSWPRSLSGAAPVGATLMRALSASDADKACASKRSCNPSASLASPPITVLSDGGDDISHVCKLPAATARVLDWFHIDMRFEQLLLSLRGRRGADAYTKYRLQGDVIAAKGGCLEWSQGALLQRARSIAMRDGLGRSA